MGNILVVDDDPVSLQFVQTILKNEGYDVSLASNGNEALQKIEEESIDVVISDINMPSGISGFQLVETIRTQNPLKRLPIVLLTGRRDKSDVHRAAELGIDDYLVKPVNPGLLLAKITTLLWHAESEAPEINFAQAALRESCSVLVRAHVINLSEQGITIRSEVSLPINKRISIETETFSKMGFKTPPLRVVNVQVEAKDGNTYYVMRLHFIGLKSLDLQRIRNWINTHHVGNDGQGNFKRA